MRHHEPAGSDETNDPAGWDRASYTPDLLAELGEPLPDVVNGYRAAALAWLKCMLMIDEFITTAPDARLAVVAVAIVLGWPSTRGLTVPEIARQLGVSTSTIARACNRFREMAGLDSAGGFRLVRPGAGSSNGDNTTLTTTAKAHQLARFVADGA